MLADPQALSSTAPTGATFAQTANGAGSTALTYVCTGRGPTSSTYRYSASSSHYIDLFIGRIVGKRNRYTVRLTETELVPDPINSEINQQKTASIYFVMDVGVLGTTTNFTKMAHSLAAMYLYTATDHVAQFNDILSGQT